MTFKKYTETRISDYTILQSFFPEKFSMSQIESLTSAYGYEPHLISTKKKLEEIFKRKLTWSETDFLSSQIFGSIITKEIYENCMGKLVNEKMKNRTDKLTNDECIQINITADLYCRELFADYIGVEFSEGCKEGYVNMLLKTKYTKGE